MTPMLPDGFLGYAKFVGYLLVHQPHREQIKHLKLAWRECREPRRDDALFLLACTHSGVVCKRLTHRRNKLGPFHRLAEECHSSSLHSTRGHRYIAHPSHEDDRCADVTCQ